MKGITKVLTLMNFQDSYVVSTRDQLFQDELDWVFLRIGTRPSEALFISYAYKGTNYPLYFNDLSNIFTTKGIRLTDITSGNPANLIAASQIIVVGGGDIITFLNKMNSLVTQTFNPYTAIKNRVDTGIPYIGWNEGSAVCSPKYFKPPATVLSPGINASSFQIVTNYTNPAQSRNDIKNYLQANPSVSKAICLVDRPDGSSVRLEDSGGGILSIPSDPYPYIINYEIVSGNLQES